MKAIVSTIKHLKADVLFLVDENAQQITLESPIANVNVGDVLEIEEGKILQILGNNKEAKEKISKKVEVDIGIEEADKVISNMQDKLNMAAKLFIRQQLYAAPTIIRFHDDTDGISGAYAIYKALKQNFQASSINIIWLMHRSIAYTETDYQNDLLLANGFESIERPLLFITDFGTSEESTGIEHAADKFNIIWLDHHPVPQQFKWEKLENYINPWLFGGDSNITAGFITTEFASKFGDLDAKRIIQASFIGDYSAYVRPDQEARELATIFDLATSDSRTVGSHSGNLSPETIEGILKDKTKMNELISYAENKMTELLDNAILGIKIHKTENATIYVVDFEKIRKDDKERYPLPGRFASKLMERTETLGDSSSVVVLHFGPFISMRVGKGLKEKVNLLKTIEMIKDDLGNQIASSGGHLSAASIKLKSEENKKEVIARLVEELKKQISRT